MRSDRAQRAEPSEGLLNGIPEAFNMAGVPYVNRRKVCGEVSLHSAPIPVIGSSFYDASCAGVSSSCASPFYDVFVSFR
jgi:hypothetical protein